MEPTLNENVMIAPEALESFISKFWGYGTFEAPIWLVGMEEACGENDVPKRISAWQRRGERPLEDEPRSISDKWPNQLTALAAQFSFAQCRFTAFNQMPS
ncbi:hypothetical protein OIHEL45_16224 [Sulfitobacter indolifex HEL-45]|uniref:Uncharacterized protein n=2 Tax=Sulfitobacter indolifex TaxID=225422 RepID=A0ABM9X4T0_9RHOB|nr:hypothetical protein OIHEL45_16224 [Sulfitobacter indolifex HEL-45]